MSISPDRLSAISIDDLKEYFECPVCYSVPRRPPIYQCDKGHMICHQCRPQLSHCPQCRSQLSDGHRLLFAERLLERVPVPCNNTTEGCQVELVMRDMTRHEEECEYRRVECPNTEFGCDMELSAKKMEEHARTCKFVPITCPADNCGAKIGTHFLISHVKRRHLGQRGDNFFVLLNYVLGIVCVFSLLVNIILFWAM